MKTFVSDLIPKLKRYSDKLDNLTLLTNQHWVLVDESINNKIVYIFRANSCLLISNNGIVEKAKWEYIKNNSLLIEREDEIILFKHGFFDENVLALKIDGTEEYAFLINENKCDGELNTISQIIDFLNKKYFEEKSSNEKKRVKVINVEPVYILVPYQTDKGEIQIEQTHDSFTDIAEGRKVFINGQPAPDGIYKLGFMDYLYVKNGSVVKSAYF